MSCAFDLEHYAELLESAKAGGYRFAFFEDEPTRGDLILRHDVDLSLDAALRLAELESEAGARMYSGSGLCQATTRSKRSSRSTPG